MYYKLIKSIEEKGKSYYMIKLKDYDGPHKAIQSWFKQTFKKKNNNDIN